MQYLGAVSKNDRTISARFQNKPFNITVTKSIPQPLRRKKMKLNDSVMTYKTF